ncbi:MAG: dephospho-CoA kinase [Burkholderiales bacterium]|nr:dephospho-CoA kinase [Burkholderiales bacterium]
MTYVVGLTGGIGSGKTEVSRAFAALGADIADADVAAHAVTAKGEAGHRAVCQAFGAQCCRPDGELDREWLRRRVFADPALRAQLEALLHPLILARLDAEIGGWRAPYGLLSVPLLLERGTLLPKVARVLVVDCPEDEQVRRVMARSAIGEDEVRAIMATQLSRPQRLARADDVIDNAGPPAALAPQVARLDNLYRECAGKSRALEPAGGSPDNGPLRDCAIHK